MLYICTGCLQAVDILKAALRSKTVLTDVYLKSNRERIVSHYSNGPGTKHDSPFYFPSATS